MLRRLKNSVSQDSTKKVADSIYNSKIRYGLQLTGKIRWTKEDPKDTNSSLLQKAQNKMLRCINNSQLGDKIRTQSMLEKFKMLSVNQMNAQIKLTEIWKAENTSNYPLQFKKKVTTEEGRTTRSITAGQLIESGKSNLLQSTFISDASRAWNRAPDKIKHCNSIWSAKKEIKKYVSTLPV